MTDKIDEVKKKFISKYLVEQFMSGEAPDDECAEEAEFICGYFQQHCQKPLGQPELKLLSDEEIHNLAARLFVNSHDARVVAQAQLDADKKALGGE